VTRARGELPEPEEALLGIERPSEEDEAEAQRRADEKREFRRLGLLSCLQHEWFREWLMEWLTEFGAFGNPLAASPNGFPDPMATQFYLGRKAAGWQLWEFFDGLSPEMASLMRREARERGL
jgi:hypothetical protein